MWNEPPDRELEKIPGLYETENIPARDKIIHMHFFLLGCDWYMAEYSLEERIFFGYAILNADFQNSEWGYISYDELCEVRTPMGYEVDRDLYWQLRKASEVQKIALGEGW